MLLFIKMKDEESYQGMCYLVSLVVVGDWVISGGMYFFSCIKTTGISALVTW